MDLKIHPLFLQEIHRMGFHIRDLMVIQFLNLTTMSIFSFLLQEILPLHFEIGSCFFWLCQSSSLFFFNDRFLQKDIQQGFFINILNSSFSLSAFIAMRWLLFTLIFAGSTALITPLFLMVLSLKMKFCGYFIFLLFPFSGIVILYSGLLSLLTQGMKTYIMPLLLFPLTIPLFIWTVSGSLEINFKASLMFLMSLLLCLSPFIIFLTTKIVKNLYHYN